MPRLSSIQWKALLLLVTFTTSFTVFCHCAGTATMAAAMPGCHRSCCEKPPTKPEHPQHNDCQGMQAVQFHLLEKQAADPIHAAPAPFTALFLWNEDQPVRLAPVYTGHGKLPQQWSYRHSPPDLLSLYQCFLV
jgi:hypothetical protein